MNFILDKFWSVYIGFNNNNDLFNGDDFITKSKDMQWCKQLFVTSDYYLTYTKVIGFVACIVTSEVLCIGASESPWGNVNTNKYGNISTIGSHLSEKQNILNANAYIYSERIE